MRTCPVCGKILNNRIQYSGNNVYLAWSCPCCGYFSIQSSAQDRSGLTYDNVIDKYKFSKER